jgi:prepilin-type N-terminal cleavage/methylation domain-containing protein
LSQPGRRDEVEAARIVLLPLANGKLIMNFEKLDRRVSRRKRGVTLLELVTVVVIVAIVVSLALPSFTSLTRRSRVTNAANELLTAVTFARSQAIDRQRPMSLIAVDNDWNKGWFVALDPTRSPGGLTMANAIKKGDGFAKIVVDNTVNTFTFQPDGTLFPVPNAALQVKINNDPEDEEAARSVCVRTSGQAYVVKGGATAC